MDKRIIAIHECSHAIVCQVSDPRRIPLSVSIGEDQVTGFTTYASPNKVEITSDNAIGRLATYIAGKVGEELIFGQEHGGSENDIERTQRDCEFYGVLFDDCEALALEVLTRNRVLLESMADVFVNQGSIKDQELAALVSTAT